MLPDYYCCLQKPDRGILRSVTSRDVGKLDKFYAVEHLYFELSGETNNTVVRNSRSSKQPIVND